MNREIGIAILVVVAFGLGLLMRGKMKRAAGIGILVVALFGAGFMVGYLAKPTQVVQVAGPSTPAEKPSEMASAAASPKAPQPEPAAPAPPKMREPVVPEVARPAVAIEGDLLADGGFENFFETPDQHGNAFAQWGGWKVQGECSRGVDTQVKRSGKASAWLEGHGGPCHIWHTQKVQVKPGSYRLTGYARAANLAPGLWGRGVLLGIEGEGFEGKYSPLPFGSHGWRKFERIFNFKEPGEVTLFLYLYGPGRAWLDDLSFVKLEGEQEEGLVVGEPDTADTERVQTDAAEAARIAAEKAAADRRAAEEAAERAPEQLIQDGGFEDLYPRVDQHGNAFRCWGGWTVEGECARGVDTEVKRSGNASAWLEGHGGPCHIWHSQKLNTRAGTYKLTGYLRAQDLQAAKWGRAFAIGLEPKDGKAVYDPLPTGTYGWRKF
ncbi:MAG TPA: hypothetical protein VMZ92_21525, partial [Planctomycetota bacterium]|nr:hypothetical protein [Planctomycetota bacterium]